MEQIEISEINDIEAELDNLMKNYRDIVEKIKQGDDDCKVLKHTISTRKLQLEDKLVRIAENNHS